MNVVHPFVKRIRAERTIVSMINKRSFYFGSELTGLSKEAVKTWFSGISEPIMSNESVKRVRDRLEYIGQLTKLASNGSHRGATIAPAPNEELTEQLIQELSKTLLELPSTQGRDGLSPALH